MRNRLLSNRSCYTYEIEGRILSIIDLDEPASMSVTNNIENICEQIAYEHGLDLNKYTIIYRDSEGRWDGFDWKTQEIILCNVDIEKLFT